MVAPAYGATFGCSADCSVFATRTSALLQSFFLSQPPLGGTTAAMTAATNNRRIETILLVEEDRLHRRASQRWLEADGRVVLTSSSCVEAIGIAHRERVDLVVVDLVLR